MSRVLVQFDGGNFYKKVKFLCPDCHLTNFGYDLLVSFLTRSQKNHSIYYVGEIKKHADSDFKTQSLYKNQQSLFQNLRQKGINIKLGYLLQNNGVYREKGVDVQIALDLALGAVQNMYDEFFLLSSDTDLLPAIKIARNAQKKVIYVGFENGVSYMIKRACSSSIILKTENLKVFCK